MRKNTVLFIFFLLSIFAVHAQRHDTLASGSQQQYSRYMKYRSTYKTIGWVLVGTSVTLAATSYLINVANGFHGKTKGENLFIAGVTAAAVSPPFFILAGINKRKAKLVLKSERLTSAIMFSKPYFPAISTRFDL